MDPTGQIARLTGGETGNQSPLAVEMYAFLVPLRKILQLTKNSSSSRFVVMLSTIAIIFAVVFLVVGVTTVYKGKATQTFTFAVSILVAFVPEGLPSTVTLLYVHRILFYFSPLKRAKAIHCCKAYGFSERPS